MKDYVAAGITDRSVLVYIPDGASTDGSGKTGLVAANLTVSHTRMEDDNDAIHTDETANLNNLAALTTAHTDWGWIEINSTTAPGLYRLDIDDGVFATGAWYAVVYVMVTTSAASATPMEFVLTGSVVNAIYSDTTIITSNLASGGGDISDIRSMLSDINSGLDVVQTTVSDIQSDTNVMVPIISDIQSDTNVLITRTLLIVSDTSDILSHLAAYDAAAGLLSDINSGVNALQVAIPASEGDISDILSRLTVTNSQIVVVKSDAAHIESQATVIKSDVISNATVLAGVRSDTTTLASDLAEGDFSDILSAIAGIAAASLSSDQDSKLTAIATTVLASGTLFEMVSDIYSDTTVIETVTSDIQSDTNVMVPIISDIQSDTSDIQSKLVALAAVCSDIQSDTNVMVPVVSDIQSDTNVLITTIGTSVTGILSDINSGIDAIQAAGGSLSSDQDSKLTAVATTVLASGTLFEMVSDIYSDTTEIGTTTGAIKTKTDSLTFTTAGEVDANIQSVNDVPVAGTGAVGDEWGP